MKYDVVIAGGGTAGAILAARLSEDPARAVLLLEAGPDYAGIDALPPKIRDGYTTAADITPSDHDWGYTGRATPLAGPLGVPRGKLTGGSSAVNGQIFLRGIPEDFDAWAALGNPAWSFQRVLPFFRRLERDLDFRTDYHGADGPIPVRRFRAAEWLPPQVAFHSACLDAGFADCPDLNAPTAEGVGPVPLNNYHGVRWGTNLGYLDPARHRLNLTVRAHCTVQRVLFQGRRATGLLVSSGPERFTVQAGQVILCAGAIGSPHLLLLSGIGPAAQLEAQGLPVQADLPGVGRNLRDHPHLFATWRPAFGYPMHPQLPRYQTALRYTAPRLGPPERHADPDGLLRHRARRPRWRRPHPGGGDAAAGAQPGPGGRVDRPALAGPRRAAGAGPQSAGGGRRPRPPARRPAPVRAPGGAPRLRGHPGPAPGAGGRAAGRRRGARRLDAAGGDAHPPLRGHLQDGAGVRSRWPWWTRRGRCTDCRGCGWPTPPSCRTACGPTPTPR